MLSEKEFNREIIKVIDILDKMFNNIQNIERRVKINVIKTILFDITF